MALQDSHLLELKVPNSLQIKQVIDPLMLTNEQCQQVADIMHKELNLGMSKDARQRKKTSMQMENTFVRCLLDGTEQGDYLALDLGGTNFRVLLVQMIDGQCISDSRNYNVPKQLLTEPAARVFDHIAAGIHHFLGVKNMLDRKLPLGFTFSFPMVQKAINNGELVTWTKTFACSDGVGENVVRLLEDAIAKIKDLNVEVVAILNDTTGTLLAGSYIDKKCYIGLIMGTGSNIAYVEQIENIANWIPGKEDAIYKQTVIDTECGAFGDNGSINFCKTKFDGIIDEHSHHVGSFTFEKLFSGHYIGDIARLVLLELVEKQLIFKNMPSDILTVWKSFTAEHLSNIERDTNEDTKHTQKMLEDLGLIPYATQDDITVVRYLCSALSIRAAQYVSTALAGVLKQMKSTEMTIAIDGTLYRRHPKINKLMLECLRILKPNTKVCLIDAVDGSGRGAALVAAVTVRINKLNKN